MAVAILSVSALAGDDFGLAGTGGVDILGTGIYETDGALTKFPAGQDTNIDTLEVGNDRAFAYGSIWQKTPKATATNDLEIKKNQDSGDCQCCDKTEIGPDPGPHPDTGVSRDPPLKSDCKDCCTKVNIDSIKVGNREAMAFGFAAATNNVKIVANQQ